MSIKIAILQESAVPLDPAVNLSALRDAAVHARSKGVGLIITPELFVTAYAPQQLAEWLSPARVQGFTAALAEIAQFAGIAVCASFPLARPDGSFAIAAGLWDEYGRELLRYEKLHLWGDAEPLAFTPGTAAPRVAKWRGRNVALQICYDIEFPEPSRFAAAHGADLLLVPTAIDGDSLYVPDLLVRARAAENRLQVVYADYPGPEFAGASTVAGYEGRVLDRLGTEPEMRVIELPAVLPGEVDAAGAGADYIADYRPALYRSWVA